MEAVIPFALLFAVFFWTCARAARALGNCARELQQIEKRQRRQLADLDDAIEHGQRDTAPRWTPPAASKPALPVTFGRN
jgi:hypothetical protein